MNGMLDKCVAGILNVGFKGVDSEELLLDLDDVALSTGAACSSLTQEPSHVLKSLGISDDQISNTVRFSLGRFTTMDEIDYVITAVQAAVNRLRL